jgi:hypothetical protein
MWRRRFPWSDATALCSGEDQDIPVDGVSKGEVCSLSEQEMLFHQPGGGFVACRACRRTIGRLIRRQVDPPGAGFRLKHPGLGRPRHDSG